MAEPVFRTLEILATLAVAAAGTEITYNGVDNIPEQGGAVVAVNHTSYIDWLPAALATHHRHRRVRFMIKEEMQQVRIIRYLIGHTGTIPVDRSAGAHAYSVAVDRLKAGDLVGVYPEATISRSFELKEFKSGAARMAREANVPIVPIIVWGAQRIWTKDHPKNLGRTKIGMTVYVGSLLFADDSVEGTNAVLRESMTALLYRAQGVYPHPAGAFWVPRRLGGSAPTLAEAKVLDEAELAERARRRAKPGRADPGRADPGRAERGRADPGRADRGQAKRGRADRGRADRGRAERTRAERGRAERTRAERGRAERTI